ncbi:PAS domain S-box protein [Bacillus weihaiensis]|uniref:PAS domain S-box protein n=1 Tax=Bacillus weihaiensis TaxID=1547283 RepID=UPI002357452A|nr:PAS domain S-box protein [Bacillus weihaiensis]
MILKSSVLEKVFFESRIPQMILEQDTRQNIVNYAFYQFIGYSEIEWDTMSLKDISHPEDYQLDLQLFRDMQLGQRDSFQVEKRFFHKSGDIIWGTLHVTLIHDYETGKKYFLSQVLDISEEKNLERVLTKSEQQYQLLAENSSDIINLHLKDGRYIYNSPSLKAILGYDPSDLIGDTPYDYIHEDDKEYVEDFHRYVLEQREPVLITYRFRKKDGTYIPFESSIKSVVDEKTGNITGIISVSRDIRQRVEQDNLLRKSEKLAITGQLAAALAHEIRNPLTSIKGFIQLFSKSKECDESFLTITMDEIQSIEEKLSEFLRLSHPSAMKMEQIKLDQLLNQVVQLLQSKALLDNKEIKTHLNTVLPFIMGDEQSLKQVFFNIIQNGLDAISEKGFVLIKSAVSKSKVTIYFIDNGRGIPKERLQSLGQPYYSTTEKGTGLGLMTTFKILQQHDGVIEVDSTVGIGTTVSVSFPII